MVLSSFLEYNHIIIVIIIIVIVISQVVVVAYTSDVQFRVNHFLIFLFSKPW